MNTFKTMSICLIIISLTYLASCSKAEGVITVASKNFTENILLAELISQQLEADTDLTIKRKLNMGSTFVVFTAIKNREIDIYPDYDGTIHVNHLGEDVVNKSVAEIYNFSKEEMFKRFNLVILDPFGFNNTYAMGFLTSTVDELNLKKISDLRNHPQLRPGFDFEFLERPDGALAMFDAYGLTFDAEPIGVEIGLKYNIIVNDEADFTDVFTTDAKLKRFNMTYLEDDLNFFPPYNAMPVVNGDTLKEYPEIQRSLANLRDVLNEEKMQELNYLVEEEQRSPQEVIVDFLKELRQ